MARELIIPFLITANYQTSLAIRQLRGELGQLPAELTALRAAAAEVYAIGAMGLFSLGMLAVGAQQLASSLLSAQRMAALAAVASGQFAAASAVSNEILKQAAALSKSSAVSLEEISSAYLEAARAGLTFTESASMLPSAMQLAIVSGGNVAETFRMTFAILRNMGIPITTQYAKTLTSQLSYALDQSLMDIEDVMNAIKYVGPIAGQLRIPLNELFAALMLLHDAGIRASIAGTGLARMLIRLEAPTAQARKALAAIGIDWRELRPSGRHLADILELLAKRADELTIRLLLGERAERAFYALVTQGTHRLRELSDELQVTGDSGDYLQRKFKSLMETPAFRMQAAMTDIRTMGMILIEPFVKWQLTLAEGFRDILAFVTNSPVLTILTKFSVGMGSLVGSTLLLGSTLSWLIGRFLELGTIWHHLLTVVDRLQAAVRALTLSALKAPAVGIFQSIKSIAMGRGLEDVATWISGRLRISELTSAMSQYLVFWRRARRIPPEFQPLPEYFSLQFGSMGEAAAKLGVPIETFLMAAPTFAGIRATALKFRPASEIADMMKQQVVTFFKDVLFANSEQALLDMLGAIDDIQRAAISALARELPIRIAGFISQFPIRGSLVEWFEEVNRAIATAIAAQDVIIRPYEFELIGIGSAELKRREEFAKEFVKRLTQFQEQTLAAAAPMLAQSLASMPEVTTATRVSARIRRTVEDLMKAALVLPADEFIDLAASVYENLDKSVSSVNKKALPFLMEYQRKIQAMLRQANVPGLLRAFLMGIAVIPTDLLEDASRYALGAMTGIASARARVANVIAFIERLANEFGAYLMTVPNAIEAAAQIGLSFGLAAPKIATAGGLILAAQQRLARLRELERLRALGIATAQQVEELMSLQRQVGLLGGIIASTRVRNIMAQVLEGTRGRGLAAERLNLFYNAIAKLRTGKVFEPLVRALGGLGIDLPEAIGRLLREGESFYRFMQTQLGQLPEAGMLKMLWMRLALNVMRAQRAVGSMLTPDATQALVSQLVQFGMTEAQALDVVRSLEAGILFFLAEQAALGRSLDEAMQAASGIRRQPPYIRWLANIVGAIRRNFIPAVSLTLRALPAALASLFSAETATVIANAASSVIDRFRAIAGWLGQIASQAIKPVRNFFATMAIPFRSMFAEIAAAVADSARVVTVRFVRPAGQILIRTVTGIGEALSVIFVQPFSQAFVALARSIGQGLRYQLSAAVVRVSARIWQAIIESAPGYVIYEFIRVFVSGITTVARDLGQRISDVAALAGRNASKLASLFSAFGSSIVDAVGSVRTQALKVFDSANRQVTARSTEAIATITRLLSREGIFAPLVRLFAVLSAAVSDRLTVIGSKFREIADAFVGIFIYGLFPIIEDAGRRIASSISSVSYGLVAQARALSGTITQYAVRGLAGLREFVKPIIDSLSPIVHIVSAGIASIGAFMQDAFIRPIARILRAVFVKFPSELSLGFIQATSGIWRPLVSAFSRAITGAASFVRATMKPSALFQSLLGSVIIPPLNSVKKVWQSVAQYLMSLGSIVTTPIVKVLNQMPQYLLASDIIRAVASKSLLGLIAKFAGVGGILALIFSFVMDIIPWEDLGKLFNWSRKTVVATQMSGRFIRTWLSAAALTLIATIKGIFWDIPAGIIDALRRSGPGIRQRLADTISATKESIQRMFYEFMTDFRDKLNEANKVFESQMLQVTQSFSRLRTTIADSFDLYGTQITKFSKDLAEIQADIAAIAAGVAIAPPGIDERATRIGELVTTYNIAAEDLQLFFEQHRAVQNMFAAIFGDARQMESVAATAANVFRDIMKVPTDMWKTLMESEGAVGIPGELQKRLETIQKAAFGPGPSLQSMLANLRARINQLPVEQRKQLSGTIDWIEQAQAKLNQLREVLSVAFVAPEKARDSFVQIVSDLASVFSPDQFRSSVLQPLETTFEDMRERFVEFRRQIKELLDPRVIREFANSLSQLQFDYLTEGFRQSAEATRAFNEYLASLGFASAISAQSAEDLYQAYSAVLSVLSKPALTPDEAFRVLGDAFERVSDESSSVKINFEKLYRLLQEYNFLAVTPEASGEVRRRLAELGKAIVDEFNRIREMLREVAASIREAFEGIFELMPFERLGFAGRVAKYFTDVSGTLVEQGIETERRQWEVFVRELQVRATEMLRMGASFKEVNAMMAQEYMKFYKNLFFTRPVTVAEQLETFKAIASYAETIGDPVIELAMKQRQASILLNQAFQYELAAAKIRMKVGYETSASAQYYRRALELWRQAAELSLDLKVKLQGIGAIWDAVRESMPSDDEVADFADKIALLPTYLSAALSRIGKLMSDIARLSVMRTWDAFVARWKAMSNIRQIVREVFAKPSEIANTMSRWTEMLKGFLERGRLPEFLYGTFAHVRAILLNNLESLRQFYSQELVALMQMQAIVPFGTRVWLELNERILNTVDSLSKIYDQLRDIRLELLQLELIALPERISEFVIAHGPALMSFLRTGPSTGISTITFSINIYAQDISAGVQQALYEAQRRLQGFSMQPVF